jgi:hypothetical protein
VFAALAERLVHAPQFPSVDALYARLGLRADGSVSEAGQHAPAAWVAAAITEGTRTTTTLALFAH